MYDKKIVDFVEYEYSIEDDEITIEKVVFHKSRTVVIPNEISGCPVTTIGGFGVFGKELPPFHLKLPNTLVEIYQKAFEGCSSLESIEIPASVKKIHKDTLGDHNFTECHKLCFKVAEENECFSTDDDGLVLFNKDKSVLICSPAASGDIVIPETVTKIDYYAFYECASLKSVFIPNSVKSMRRSAFEGCLALQTVIGAEGLMSIERDAFAQCHKLPKFYITKNLKSIDDGAFAGCNNIKFDISNENEYFTTGDDNGFLFNKDKTELICAPMAEGDVILPESLKEIRNDAFNGAVKLKSIVIPESVSPPDGWNRTFWSSVFAKCSSLESIHLPKQVTEFGGLFFWQCSALKKIHLPKGFKGIHYAAFSGCKSLERVKIPKGVEELGESAFEGCSALKEITIPGSVKWTNWCVFENCFSLERVVLSEGVQGISSGTFSSCVNLKEVYIPTTLEKIEPSSFAGCFNLRFRISKGNKYFSTDEEGVMLFNKDKTELICVPGAAGDFVVPNGVECIAEGAFASVGKIASVGSPNDPKQRSFGVQKLTSITIPDSVEKIGSGAFAYCKSVEKIFLPETLTKIESATFEGCESLESITIPSHVYSIEAFAFHECSKLKDIRLPKGLKEIDEYAFGDCPSLKNFVLPTKKAIISPRCFDKYIS